MNLKKTVLQYGSLVLLAIIFESRAIWEYSISPNIHTLLIESSIAFAVLIFLVLLTALSTRLKRGRKENLGGMLLVLLTLLLAIDFWLHHSRIWAILSSLLGLLLMTIIWKDRLFPHNEEREQAKRARIEKLFADRTAFEESWQRRTKIGEGILLLICALLTVVCWITSSKILATVPALLAALFLIGLFGRLIPMSDEKFEDALAKAKARNERSEARRAKYAARRAERAERLEGRNKRQKASNPSAESFSSFVYWSLMICIFALRDRSSLEKPDLVFCAMPAWYLLRALYFFFLQAKTPKGPAAPSASEPSTSSLAT